MLSLDIYPTLNPSAERHHGHFNKHVYFSAGETKTIKVRYNWEGKGQYDIGDGWVAADVLYNSDCCGYVNYDVKFIIWDDGKNVGSKSISQDLIRLDKKVLTYYFYWYDGKTGDHVWCYNEYNGTKDSLTNDPIYGKGSWFSWDNPDFHKVEFARMKRSGIDIALPLYLGDCAGTCHFHGNCPQPRGKTYDYGIDHMVKALDELESEGKGYPLIGMFYGTGANETQYKVCEGKSSPSLPSLYDEHNREVFYQMIKDFYVRVPDKYVAKIGGRYIVWLYSADFFSEIDCSVLDFIRDKFKQDFNKEILIVADRNWGSCESIEAYGTYVEDIANLPHPPTDRLDICATAAGWDTSAVNLPEYGGCGNRWPSVIDRKEGQTYINNWNECIADNEGWIVIDGGWNEYHEGSDICPTEQYGVKYLELTNQMVKEFKGVAPIWHECESDDECIKDCVKYKCVSNKCTSTVMDSDVCPIYEVCLSNNTYNTTGKCSINCGAKQGCDGKAIGSCSSNSLKKCGVWCQEVSSCGDGTCNCGENASNCPQDCPVEAGCTDTDGGNNIFEKGTTCRPSTITPGALFCKTDECASATSLKEYYCNGDTMVTKTIACANGCVAGACAQEQEQEQRSICIRDTSVARCTYSPYVRYDSGSDRYIMLYGSMTNDVGDHTYRDRIYYAEHFGNGIDEDGWMIKQPILMPEVDSRSGESGLIHDPAFVLADGVWHVYYTGAEPCNDYDVMCVGNIFHAAGPDLFHLEKQGIIGGIEPADYSFGKGEPSVLYEDGIFKLFYFDSAGESGASTYLAESTDGHNFTYVGGVSPDITLNPSVSKQGDEYVLVFSGGSGTGDYKIYISKTKNLPFPEAQAVFTMRPGEWDSTQLGHPYYIDERIYYDATNKEERALDLEIGVYLIEDIFVECNLDNTNSTGKCSHNCGAFAECEGITPNACSANSLKKCDSNCQEIFSCGDAICNCGETTANCPQDCPVEVGCTDTDGGENVFEQGTTCRPSTITHGALFCKTDECASATSLKEFYCNGDTMVSKTVACANGCNDGACLRVEETEQGSVGFGWDYNLTKKCVQTTGSSGDENYYQDITQCENEKQWLIAVESEKTFGESCPGPQDRSFLVNGSNSPVKLNWKSHQSEYGENWSVNMKTDMINYSHSCGDGHFTWFAFMDQDGPLPKPRELVSSNIISYNDFVLSDSATRCIVAAQFFWDGKARLLEVNVASTNWGDKDDHPGVIVSAKNILGGMDYLALDGAYFGYQLQLSEDPNWKWGDTKISIDWTSLIDFSINEGYFDAPADWENTATQSVQVASEVYNEAIADLWHTDFRISSKSGYGKIISVNVNNSNPKIGDTVKINYTVENIGADGTITVLCGPGHLPEQHIFSQYLQEKTYILKNNEQKIDFCSFIVGEDLYQKQENGKDIIGIVAGFHSEPKIWDQTKYQDITIHSTSTPICTDTDDGNDIYEQGTCCRPSTVTPGALFCKTDECASATSLKEFYCNGDTMVSQTITCANTCIAGACLQQQELISNLKDPGITKHSWEYYNVDTGDNSCSYNSSPETWRFLGGGVDGTPCTGGPIMEQEWNLTLEGKYEVKMIFNNTQNSFERRCNNVYRNFYAFSDAPFAHKNILYVPELKQLVARVTIEVDEQTSVCNTESVCPICPPDFLGSTTAWTAVLIGIPLYDEKNERNLWIEISPYWTEGAEMAGYDDQYLFSGEAEKEELERIKITHPAVNQLIVHPGGDKISYEIDVLSVIDAIPWGHQENYSIDWNSVHATGMYTGIETWGWTFSNITVSDIDFLYELKSICGDGKCEQGETPENCLQDCGGSTTTCTDTDKGNNIYQKGTACRPSTVTPDELFCKTDKCVSATSLTEYYCNGDTMVTKTIACANGCLDGACLQEPEPPVCGDGVCEQGETQENCPQDCAMEENEFIKIAPDNWSFETANSKQSFVPFGCNYYDPITFDGASFAPVLSLEADRTDRHFAQLESIGVNTVRIFLSVISLAPELQEISEDNFQKVDKIVELAKKHNLRIIFDIADGFVPVHYINEHILERLDFLAATFVKRYANEPTIFAWDLQNEPTMMWSGNALNSMWQDWARSKYITESALSSVWSDYPFSGESWNNIKAPADKNNLNNQRLFDYQLFREDIAYNWVERLTNAIRSEDKNHPITIGNIQWATPLMKPGDEPQKYAGFNPVKLNSLLDFTSVHGYDWNLSNTDNYIDGLLRYSYANKPVILEEFVYSDSTIDKTLGSASGWLAWSCYGADGFNWDYYLFDSNEQMTDLGIAFKNKAHSVKNQTLIRSSDKTVIPLDMKELLTDVNKQGQLYDELVQIYNAGNGPVGFVAHYPDDTICTDTDKGNNIFEKGTTCRPSTVTPGALFCKTDECVSATSLTEYYCNGDTIVRKTVDCRYGCADGACARDTEPEQPVCGNNICEQGETSENCPQDCEISISSITIEAENFYLNTQKWFPFGINYWPSHFSHIIEPEGIGSWYASPYYENNIELIEKDLSKIQELGFNSIWIDANFSSTSSSINENFVDFLSKAKNHNLRVGLSLYVCNPFWNNHKSKCAELIKTLHNLGVTQDDNVFAYDLAWEVIAGNYDNRNLLKRKWSEWIINRYGNVENAENAWGHNLKEVCGQRDSIVMSHNIPSKMIAGQKYNVEIRIKNVGREIWTEADSYKLGAKQDTSIFAATRYHLNKSEIIESGQIKTFNFDMTAPVKTGVYYSEWRMLQELVAWFGEEISQQIIVVKTGAPIQETIEFDANFACGPSDEQLCADSSANKMVAAYRRFIDDYSNKEFYAMIQEIKKYDTNHLITVRMGRGGNGVKPVCPLLPLDIRATSKYLDFISYESWNYAPENDIKESGFISNYGNVGKPTINIEYGGCGCYTGVNCANCMCSTTPNEQKIYYQRVFDMMIESGTKGSFNWWFKGVRPNEKSDYGVVRDNDNLDEKPVCDVIKSYADQMKNLPDRTPNYWITVDRDAHAGEWQMYQIGRNPYLSALNVGKTPGVKTVCTNKTSKEKLSNDGVLPKCLNALFESLQVKNFAGIWVDVKDNDKVEIKNNKPLYARVSVGNLGEAKWLTANSAQGASGAVKLGGNENNGLGFRINIVNDVQGFGSYDFGEFKFSDGIAGQTNVRFQMVSELINWFGESVDITLIPKDAQYEQTCTDTDGENNIYEKGTTCRPSTITPGELFCKTDECVSATSLKEYYCNGDTMERKTITCRYGCADGACAQGRWQWQEGDSSGRRLPIYGER